MSNILSLVYIEITDVKDLRKVLGVVLEIYLIDFLFSLLMNA